jgi:serine/threonine-protein kinase RsbW
VIAILPRPTAQRWRTVSFASTLYLVPILDLLLETVPRDWHMEVRLGLQEALVNAAKHGNALDPGKQVEVRYRITSDEITWVIADQGGGFDAPDICEPCDPMDWICDEQECGRGLFILYQVFDHVEWQASGTQLHLRKRIRRHDRQPYVA